MLEYGFIKLHRTLINWEWYQDINTKVLFIHLLLTANYEDKKWKGIEVKRGSKITSSEKLAQETGLSRQQIRTVLNRLKSTNEITIKSTNKYMLISIVKYSNYQDTSNNNNQQDNQQINHPLTSNQPTNNHNVRNKKKDKEVKNIYGQYKNVKLSDGEYKRLSDEFAESTVNKAIEYLSSYKKEKGYITKDDNLTIRRWVLKAVGGTQKSKDDKWETVE